MHQKETLSEVLKNGIVFTDTDDETMLSTVTIPILFANVPLRGTIQLFAHDAAEVRDLRNMVEHLQPAGPGAPIRMNVSIFDAVADALINLPFDTIGAEGLLTIVRDLDDDDYRVTWKLPRR